MKNRSIRIMWTITVLGAVFLSLACPSEPQNTNTNENSPPTVETATPVAADVCASGTLQEKIAKLKTKIKGKIDGVPALKKQFDLKQIEFTIDKNADNVIVMTVKGRVSGTGNLAKFFNTFSTHLKKGCVAKVRFTALGTAAIQDPGFEGNVCEEPTQPCSDGECREVCLSATPDPKDSNSKATNAN